MLILLFQSDVYNTFHVICVIKIEILLQFGWQHIKDNNTSTNWWEISIFSRQWCGKQILVNRLEPNLMLPKINLPID